MKNSETNYVRIIREICEEEDIKLTAYSSDWIFRLEKNGIRNIILGYQFGLNSASVNMLCNDKCGASELMTACGIPNIEHELFASPENQKFLGYPGCFERLLELLKCHGRIVCKPNQGTGGDNVYLCRSAYELETAVHSIFMKSDYMAVSKYYEFENEYRAVMLDGKVHLAYRKRRPQITGDGIHTTAGLLMRYFESADDGRNAVKTGDLSEEQAEEMRDLVTASGEFMTCDLSRIPAKGESVLLNWKHNLGQGARADILSDGPVLRAVCDIAGRVYEEIGVRFASIDVVDTAEGMKVLELNSGVMMENFAGQGEVEYNTAKEIYRDAILLMMSRS